MNESLINFNKRKRIYFDRKKQKNVKIRLIYKLFKTKVAYVCLQQ